MIHEMLFIKNVFYLYLIAKLINACSKHHTIDYIRAVFTLIFGSFYIYFVHVIQHKYSDSMFGKIHTDYHHNPKYKHKWYSKVIEFFNNSQLLLFILVNNLIKKFTNIEIFSNYILFFWAMIYTWTHEIEYHNHPSCIHMYHHKFDNEENQNHSSEIKNYGPTSLDIMFNTFNENCNQEHDLIRHVRHLMILYIMYIATSLIYKIKNNGVI